MRAALGKARALLWAAARGDRLVIRMTGAGNVLGSVITFFSYDHLRRDLPYLGSVPGSRILIAQNFLHAEFVSWPGPRLYFSKEPLPFLSDETRENLRRPELAPFFYRFDEPDVARRMFYPVLRTLDERARARLERDVGVRRPRLACLVNRYRAPEPGIDLVGERIRIAEAMGRDLAIFGEEPRHGENGWRTFPSYRGATPDKARTLRDHSFNVCFENTDSPGYITEKIVDALVAGCVPLYRGGGAYLRETIPADAFIDCRDQEPAAIHARVRRMPHDEIVAYRRAGLRFLRSPAARRFTRAYWVAEVIRRLQATASPGRPRPSGGGPRS